MFDTPTIRVRNLSKNYGKVQALRDVGVEVSSGCIFGLLGPNGAGKTTFIRLLTGSSRRDAGEMSVLGLDPAQNKWELRRWIGYMPQEAALYEDLSARENITFFAQAHRRKGLAQRIEETLEFVGLTGRSRDPLYKLSGGMKQRVSLACALVHQPQVLFLDEPTTGIDPKLRESFWRHFRQLADEGCTILISTHQMDEALYCDRLAILQEGELLAVDTPRALLKHGKARIQITHGDRVERIEAHDYPHRLPELLQTYGLDPKIDSIEIEQATLEQVVLSIIADHAHRSAEGS
jgi:ABC-2 type transport system ATP-binding protein